MKEFEVYTPKGIRKNVYLASEVEELIEENKNQNYLFELQHERSLEADKLWQEATGNTYYPDLGVLLEWLMSQIKQETK